jgi:hypothetical protein
MEYYISQVLSAIIPDHPNEPISFTKNPNPEHDVTVS